MHKLEAQYKALAAGLDPKHVEAAELLVRKAMDMSATTLHPLPDVLCAMLTAATACADANALTATAAAALEIVRLRRKNADLATKVRNSSTFCERLETEIKQLQSDIDDLNALLRGVGWGQGEIDSSASFAEKYERLRDVVYDREAKLVAKLSRIAHAGARAGRMRHDIGQLLMGAVQEAAEKAPEKPSAPEDSGV